MSLVTRHIPIVFYNADGTKVPVGVLELAEGDNVMIGTITDPRVKEIIMGGVTAHLSIDIDEATERTSAPTDHEFGLVGRREERHISPIDPAPRRFDVV